MSFEITGKLIQKNPVQQVSEKFKKREFVLELSEIVNGNTYTNFAKFQLVQNKCDALDHYNEGDMVRVNFNLKGNRWERDGKVNYITNLDAWRIESASQPAGQPQAAQGGAQPVSYNTAPANYSALDQNAEPADDLPF